MAPLLSLHFIWNISRLKNLIPSLKQTNIQYISNTPNDYAAFANNSRVLSGKGSETPKAPNRTGSRSRSPIRARSGRNVKHQEETTDSRIFANDMYTIDFVMDKINAVGKDESVNDVTFEDLIERNEDDLTKAVHDLFVNTTMSAKRLEGGSEGNATKSVDNNNNNIKSQKGVQKTQSLSSTPSSSSSSGGLFGFGKRTSAGRSSTKNKARVWKSITFVDCISDATSYEFYLQRKYEFLVNMTRFLKIKGFQNDLPIQFEAKIEIHTMLDAITILDLLQAIQRDTSVTRIKFDGALNPKSKHIPEDFEKLVDKETLCMKEVVLIHLHYDKESFNVTDLEEDEEADFKRVSARRQSQLTPSVLMTVQRCAMIMEQILNPDMDLSDSFNEHSDGNMVDVSVKHNLKPVGSLNNDDTRRRQSDPMGLSANNAATGPTSKLDNSSKQGGGGRTRRSGAVSKPSTVRRAVSLNESTTQKSPPDLEHRIKRSESADENFWDDELAQSTNQRPDASDVIPETKNGGQVARRGAKVGTRTSRLPEKRSSKSPGRRKGSRSPEKKVSKSPERTASRTPQKRTSKSPEKKTSKSPERRRTSKSPEKARSKSPPKA